MSMTALAPPASLWSGEGGRPALMPIYYNLQNSSTAYIWPNTSNKLLLWPLLHGHFGLSWSAVCVSLSGARVICLVCFVTSVLSLNSPCG